VAAKLHRASRTLFSLFRPPALRASRQLLLRCSTSCIHAVAGSACALHREKGGCKACHVACKKAASHPPVLAATFQAMPPPAADASSATAPALLYLLHPCSRPRPLTPTRQHGSPLCWHVLRATGQHRASVRFMRVGACWSHGLKPKNQNP